MPGAGGMPVASFNFILEIYFFPSILISRLPLLYNSFESYIFWIIPLDLEVAPNFLGSFLLCHIFDLKTLGLALCAVGSNMVCTVLQYYSIAVLQMTLGGQ